jgi:hypothetical protein
MLCREALVRADVSEELIAFIIRVTRIGELGTTLAVTSNRSTLRRISISSRLASQGVTSQKTAFIKEFLFPTLPTDNLQVGVLTLFWKAYSYSIYRIKVKRAYKLCARLDTSHHGPPHAFRDSWGCWKVSYQAPTVRWWSASSLSGVAHTQGFLPVPTGNNAVDWNVACTEATQLAPLYLYIRYWEHRSGRV